MANKGGKRPGAGRPKGAKTLVRVLDYFTDKELKDFFENLKQRAKTDTKIALYFAEQITGKATQNIDLGNQDNKPLTIKIVNYGDNSSA